MAVGVSLGGNALLLWAGRMGSAAEKAVQAVAAVCSPLDLVACGEALETGLCRWIYTPMFLRTMKKKAKDKWRQFPGLFDLQRAMAATTLREFDDVFTAPLHGFDGVDHYWRSCSAKGVLNQIKIPALVLHALDDPFVPARSLPRVEDVTGHVTLQQTPFGGHVGYAAWDKAGSGVRGHVAWMPRTVCHWMRSALDMPTGNDHG
jgi:predicted alpha/beta-fold hydrolase